jgi:hypothetical protein
MKTSKTYVRKHYSGSTGGGILAPMTFRYAYPDDLVTMALDHGTQRDEWYELVNETVTPIISIELDVLVATGLHKHEAAKKAAERADDEREYARLAEKLGKS